jgi:hypothetical protein
VFIAWFLLISNKKPFKRCLPNRGGDVKGKGRQGKCFEQILPQMY